MFIIYNHTFKESSIVDSQQQMFNLAVANLQLILRISSCESTLKPLLIGLHCGVDGLFHGVENTDSWIHGSARVKNPSFSNAPALFHIPLDHRPLMWSMYASRV